MEAIEAVEEEFSWEKSVSADGHAALSAQMDGLPVSGTVSGEFKRANRNWADFGSLETKFIIPPEQYVKDSMARPAVKASLGRHIRPKSVFMVTGIKIARRASRGQESSRSQGGLLQLGVTPTPALPVSFGPGIGFNTSKSESTSSKSTDFIWAFSLRQVFYRQGQMIKKSVTYDNGATLGETIVKPLPAKVAENTGIAMDLQEVDIEIEGSKVYDGQGSRLVSVEEVNPVGEGLKFLIVDGL